MQSLRMDTDRLTTILPPDTSSIKVGDTQVDEFDLAITEVDRAILYAQNIFKAMGEGARRSKNTEYLRLIRFNPFPQGNVASDPHCHLGSSNITDDLQEMVGFAENVERENSILEGVFSGEVKQDEMRSARNSLSSFVRSYNALRNRIEIQRASQVRYLSFLEGKLHGEDLHPILPEEYKDYTTYRLTQYQTQRAFNEAIVRSVGDSTRYRGEYEGIGKVWCQLSIQSTLIVTFLKLYEITNLFIKAYTPIEKKMLAHTTLTIGEVEKFCSTGKMGWPIDELIKTTEVLRSDCAPFIQTAEKLKSVAQTLLETLAKEHETYDRLTHYHRTVYKNEVTKGDPINTTSDVNLEMKQLLSQWTETSEILTCRTTKTEFHGASKFHVSADTTYDNCRGLTQSKKDWIESHSKAINDKVDALKSILLSYGVCSVFVEKVDEAAKAIEQTPTEITPLTEPLETDHGKVEKTVKDLKNRHRNIEIQWKKLCKKTAAQELKEEESFKIIKDKLTEFAEKKFKEFHANSNTILATHGAISSPYDSENEEQTVDHDDLQDALTEPPCPLDDIRSEMAVRQEILTDGGAPVNLSLPQSSALKIEAT